MSVALKRSIGIRKRNKSRPGDIFLCYLTNLARWCGVLQVESEAFSDSAPRHKKLAIYSVLFKVKPLVILEAESAVSMKDEEVWDALASSNELQPTRWSWFVRTPLRKLKEADGNLLVDLLERRNSEVTRWQAERNANFSSQRDSHGELITQSNSTIGINGEWRDIASEPHHSLLEVLREELRLTGTKVGCNEGECGFLHRPPRWQTRPCLPSPHRRRHRPRHPHH